MPPNWLCVSVVEPGDDDALYPTLNDAQAVDSLANDPNERDIVSFGPVWLSVHRTWRNGWIETQHFDGDLQFRAQVTSERIQFWCRDYARGSSYIGFGGGGAAIAATASAISRARAKSRARGTVLAGHARFSWISAVGIRPQRSSGGVVSLTMPRTSDLGDDCLRVDFKVLSLLSAKSVAVDLIRRIVRSRLRGGVYPEPLAENLRQIEAANPADDVETFEVALLGCVRVGETLPVMS